MKQRLFSMWSALSLCLLAVLCSCSDNTPTSSTPAKAFIAATVGGTVWRADSIEVTRSNGTLHIKGTYNNQQMQFRLVEKFIKEGVTLSLAETHNALWNNGTTTLNSFLSPTGGSFTITLLTPQEMEASFSFAGTDNHISKTLQILRGQMRTALPQ